MTKPIFTADHFHLEIDGIATGSFVRCSNLGGSVGVFQYQEGGFDGVRQFQGARSFSPIVLERGVARDRALFEWFLKGDRRDGALLVLTSEGREAFRWTFFRAWPCRWEGPAFDASRARVALELLELAHEGVECSAR